MAKSNCWEFLKCTKEDCPAKYEKRLNSIHGGVNAGRACWVVAGTRCKGEIQGTFAQKETNCNNCKFYQAVRSEEGMVFMNTLMLLDKLKG